MGEVITLTNLKGGVGKTVSAISIAGELVELGASVLVVDTDPQSGATIAAGFSPGELSPSLTECLSGKAAPQEAIVSAEWGADVLPARMSLAFSSIRMALGQSAGQRQSYQNFRRVLEPMRTEYDIILVDTPPATSMPMIGALASTDKVLIPVDCKPLALRGLRIMLQVLKIIRLKANSKLDIAGVLPTMYRQTTLLSGEIVTALKTQAGKRGVKVFPPVKHSVRFSELPRTGGPIRNYEPELAGPYKAVAEEVLSYVEER